MRKYRMSMLLLITDNFQTIRNIHKQNKMQMCTRNACVFYFIKCRKVFVRGRFILSVATFADNTANSQRASSLKIASMWAQTNQTPGSFTCLNDT